MRETLIEEDQRSIQQLEASPLEELIDKVNGEGKYQKQSFFLFCAMWFLTACLLLGMNFFFDDAFTCKDPTLSDKQDCRTYVCSLPTAARPDAIDSHSPSIIFEFDTYLICSDHKTTVSVLQDMMFVGSLVGFFVIPFIADNFGAKLALKIAWGIATLAIILVAFSKQINMLGIGLFLIGFGANPSITLCFSFINEICLGKSRQNYSIGVQIAWALGQITIALTFLTGISWKGVMFIIFGLFAMCFLIAQFFLLESLMFLLKKYPEKALVAFNKIARLNKREELTQKDMETIHQEEEKMDLYPEQKALGVTDLFRFKSIRMTSIASAMIFFGIQVIYYSSSLSEGSIGFSKTLNQCLFATSQMAGYIVSQYVVHKFPRKKATFFGMGIASLLCLLLGVMVMFETEDNKEIMKWFQIAVLMLTSFILCCFYSIAFVYTAELYPTQIRSIGFGWVSLVGIVGSIVSPFAGTIASSISLNSWFVSAILGGVAWGFGFFLPETFGKPLKDKIEERIQHLILEKSEIDREYSDEDEQEEFDPIPKITSSKSFEDASPTSSPTSSPKQQSQRGNKKSVSYSYTIQNYD